MINNKENQQNLHDPQLEEVIILVESHHNDKAKEVLTKLLNKDPYNYLGWLWYSRILNNVSSVETSLNNAVQIAPENPDVGNEVRKFLSAKKKINTKNCVHCPFCWFLLSSESTECSNCLAFLTINWTFFACSKDASQELMQKAIKRYAKVLIHETKNTHALYYLSLAYLNLEQWAKGSQYLLKATNIASKNKFLASQLNLIMDYIASKDPSVKYNHLTKVPQKKINEASSETKTVLIVEDSSTTRNFISIILNKNGYTVLEAEDGYTAMTKLNQNNIDLILLDIILPDMDGYEIMDRIKKQPELKNIPIIMLTAKNKILDKVKGKIKGSSEYLTKPFKPDELLNILNKYH